MSRVATILLVVVTVVAVPLSLSAADYAALSGDIPFLTDWLSLGGVWNAFLRLSVVVAAILAVIMLAIGGFKYMASESVFKVQGAKEQMANAIIGLLIVLAAVLILVTINDQIVNFGRFG
jgi:hypothetical protein